MDQFSKEVLLQLRQAMVIFTIGKHDGSVGWGSGFACFPNRKAIFTCAHNFAGALPHTVIARHASSDARYHVPFVVFSEDLDCAVAILDRPLTAEPLQWADSMQENQPIAIPDYVPGSSADRFEVAWHGQLADLCLMGHSTSTITKSAIWVGTSDRVRDTQLFQISMIHRGLSGSPMINQVGAVVGQVVDSLEKDVTNPSTVNSHLLEELKTDTERIYAKAHTKKYL